MLSTYFQRNMVIVVNFILCCNNLKSFRRSRQRKDRDKIRYKRNRQTEEKIEEQVEN